MTILLTKCKGTYAFSLLAKSQKNKQKSTYSATNLISPFENLFIFDKFLTLKNGQLLIKLYLKDEFFNFASSMFNRSKPKIGC